MSADAVAIGGDQGELVGPVAYHAACRELGGGGGLSHTGGSDQRIDAAAVDDVGIRGQCPQLSIDQALGQRTDFLYRGIRGHFLGDAPRQLRGEAGLEQLRDQARACRRRAAALAPGEAGKLALEHVADARHLGHQLVVAFLQDTDARLVLDLVVRGRLARPRRAIDALRCRGALGGGAKECMLHPARCGLRLDAWRHEGLGLRNASRGAA